MNAHMLLVTLLACALLQSGSAQIFYTQLYAERGVKAPDGYYGYGAYAAPSTYATGYGYGSSDYGSDYGYGYDSPGSYDTPVAPSYPPTYSYGTPPTYYYYGSPPPVYYSPSPTPSTPRAPTPPTDSPPSPSSPIPSSPPTYTPSYPPTYTPSYPPTYTPSYPPTYTPSYPPTYTYVFTPPSYTPSYAPSYTPTYYFYAPPSYPGAYPSTPYYYPGYYAPASYPAAPPTSQTITIPAPPASYGYAPDTPSSYYSYGYGCPACTCPTTYAATYGAPTAARMELPSTVSKSAVGAVLELSAGECYCPYDHDWSRWAIADDTCREALYRRCDKHPSLRCAWLDAYYRPDGKITAAVENAISRFLYNDCPPSPPCQCQDQTTTAVSRQVPGAACCRQLEYLQKVPFSGMESGKLDAVCSRQMPKYLGEVRQWVEHSLWAGVCSASSNTSRIYKYVQDPLTRAVDDVHTPTLNTNYTSSSTTTREVAAPAPAPRESGSVGLVTLGAAAAGLVVGALVAGAVAMLWMRRQRVAMVLPDYESYPTA